MKIGAAFGDHIKTEKRIKKHYDFNSSRKMRPQILLVILFIFSGIIILRLMNIQIVFGSYYRTLSDSNRTKTITLYPERGVIFDRNGIPLVFNNPNFEKKEGNDTEQISREQAIDLFANKEGSLNIKSQRYYPERDSMSHILGYVGQISKEALSMSEYGDYTAEEIIGKSGIEQYYDKQLRGIKGKELIEVDAMGEKVRTLGSTDPIPGKNLTLAIDRRLQQVAYDALPKDKKGVVIVSKLNGEILSMVSKPSFDANLFTMDNFNISSSSTYKTISDILNDNENQPLMNRAISGTYPPGSTFKLITAAAGLEQKIIDANYKVEDTGVLRVGEFSFGNWYYLEQGKKDGLVDVIKGIGRSNDIFFYKLAEKITVDKLSNSASKFGVGKQLGIDLPGEAKGVLPTKKWKKDEIGEPWYLGDTFHYGIGQGFLLSTPLQVNAWTQVVANGGILYKPHLLKNAESTILTEKFLSDETINLIRRGMIMSCTPDGVAWPLYDFKVKNSKLKIDDKNYLEAKVSSNSAALKDYAKVNIACKTGTAQHGGEETLPHAWITLYAPAYDPQIVVTVLVESAGQGSNVAAPVAKKVLEDWFSR